MRTNITIKSDGGKDYLSVRPMTYTKVAALVTALIIAGFTVMGQTNAVPTITTNWVTYSQYRIVAGKVYDIRDTHWGSVRGTVLSVKSNLLILRIPPTPVRVRPSPNYLQSIGAYDGAVSEGNFLGSSIPNVVKPRPHPEAGSDIILINFPLAQSLAESDPINAYAMRSGVANYNDRQLAVWDIGLPYRVGSIYSNAVPQQTIAKQP